MTRKKTRGLIKGHPDYLENGSRGRETVIPIPPGTEDNSAFMAGGKTKVFMRSIEIPAGPDAEDRAVEEIGAALGLEDEPRESKADFDFEKEVAAEVKALEQNRKPGFTPPFDIGACIREKLRAGNRELIIADKDVGILGLGRTWVLCPNQEFNFDYRGPDRDYKYEARLVADDERQLRALVDQVLGSANSPFIFGGLKIYLHAAQGHGKAPEHLASGQLSLKVELIFRASAP